MFCGNCVKHILASSCGTYSVVILWNMIRGVMSGRIYGPMILRYLTFQYNILTFQYIDKPHLQIHW